MGKVDPVQETYSLTSDAYNRLDKIKRDVNVNKSWMHGDAKQS